MKKGEFKKETEGLLTAAQEQALRTTAINANIDKQAVSSKCRLCKSAEESVSHIVCECSALAQREYKGRHDGLAKLSIGACAGSTDWKLLKKWYEHVPGKVRE